MSYVAYLISGHEVAMTDEEFARLEGKTGLLFVPSAGEVINTASVSHIVPAAKAARIARAKSQYGTLHDGTRVVRRFGTWCNADNPDVAMSPNHYPEIAKDSPLLTDEEWRRDILPLPSDAARKARYAELVAGDETPLIETKAL